MAFLRYGVSCIRTREILLYSPRIYLSSNFNRSKVVPYFQFAKSAVCSQRCYASTSDESKQNRNFPTVEVHAEKHLSKRVRLKQAVRDYGATVIVFHVAISLTSLGLFYLAISNGVDAVGLLTRLGLPDSVIKSEIAVGGSTFVMAYAVHKVFAPVRIGITLTSVPFIVRYLRKIKLLKPPK